MQVDQVWTSSQSEQLDLSIVAAINDEAVLLRNLKQSPILASGRALLYEYRNEVSSAAAYNRGLRDTDSDYVAFVHQDVYLPKFWEAQLGAAIAELNSVDPSWAIIGVFGITEGGAEAGQVWCSANGTNFGGPTPKPVKIISIDELAFVMRRAAGCTFDSKLPSFHMYGTDIVQTAAKRGLNSYVADLPVVHNSRPVLTLGGGFAQSYRYMQKKWASELPIPTLTVPLVTSPLPLIKARLRLGLTRKKRVAKSIKNTADPRALAKMSGYE